jgi:hypothetical protein
VRGLLGWTTIVVGLLGCVPYYRVPKLSPTAEFTLTETSDSSSTTSRNILVWVYKNSECERHPYGMRAGSDFGNSPTATTDPTPIAAGEPFVFTAYYGESRMAQNRTCDVTGVFTPQAGHRYRALFVVEGGVSSCKLGVYDATSGKDEQIDFAMPKYICDDNGKTNRPNGQPLWLDWKIQTAPGHVR